jgi:hypothetical protein
MPQIIGAACLQAAQTMNFKKNAVRAELVEALDALRY